MRNVISGNFGDGVLIQGLKIVVQGNYIGIDVTGNKVLGNFGNGVLIVPNANGCMIGGTVRAVRNVISGNQVFGVVSNAQNTVVQGNYIGTDAMGTKPLRNNTGVFFSGSNGTIGGTAPGAGNVISGNLGDGVIVGAQNTVMQGNYIGTDANGQGQPGLGNTLDGVVLLSGAGGLPGADGSTIGGTADGARNVISGNGDNGVLINASNTVVEGNYIGTDATGKNLLFNFGNGVLIVPDANRNTIGGTARRARNVISGNLGNGVNIVGSNNVVQGNFIGPDVSGQTALADVGNFGNGVLILSRGTGSNASNNTIGGTVPGAGNVISGNQVDGVNIQGLNTVVQGNRIGIGADFTGQTALGNQGNGVFILSGGDGSTIGGTADGARNVISGNLGDGVASNANNTVVQGNYIGTDVSGDAKKLNNLGFGVRITSGSGDLIGGTSPGALNVITGNFGGINVIQVMNSTIQGNRIGIGKSDNSSVVGNSGIGVLITSSTGITIGGTTDAVRNFIENNSTGVTLDDSSGSSILGDLIQNNIGIGISIISANDNTIGGTATGAGNVIVGNNTGVSITNGNRNSIFGNSITGNLGIGVAIASGNSNPILNNTISGNGLGIELSDDANHLQNFPKLDSITTSPDGTSTRILGQLNSTPNTTFTIQLFEDVQYPSGFGQGMIFDEVKVTTDAKTGIATIDVTVPIAIAKGPFPFVSATATNLTTADTSEFSPQITEISYTVTTVADNGNDSTPTPGSLRAAILNAIANANASAMQGARMIDFKIPGQGPFTIAPPTPLPTITAPVNIDGTTQAGYDPNHPTPMIELSGHLVTSPNVVNGLTISSGNSTVKGLVIDSFTGAGIALITKDKNVIAGNYLGTDVTGTMPLPNGFGVTIIDVSSNTIGGTTDADRNLISGNGFDGVLIDTSQGMATDNVVEGNYIGTDVTGNVALANALAGVAITASTIPASNNTIGGTTPATRNVISGNSRPDGSGVGVQILGAGATGNLIEGNFIGLDVFGTHPLRNDTGVLINGAADNTIGGLTTRPGTGPGNVISSYVPSNSTNTGVGVAITGPGAMGNIVEGNLIGTDANGTRTLVADQAGLGILISNTPGSNTVGGTIAMARNIIAGFKIGIEIFAPQSPFNSPTGSTIAGNYIGTDVSGEVRPRQPSGRVHQRRP